LRLYVNIGGFKNEKRIEELGEKRNANLRMGESFIGERIERKFGV
jgi:hypothetical protein